MTYSPFGAATYNLSGSISSTDTSITLVSFLEPVTGTPYTMALLNTSIVYATIAPKTTSSEFVSFTGIVQNADGTATLTGVTRGLAKKSPFTASASYRLPHSGQTQFIISDAPQVFNKYTAAENDENVTGLWNFVQTPTGLNPGAVPDASTSVKGLTKLSAAPTSATEPIAVSVTDTRMPAGYAADAGANDTYVITLSQVPTAYTDGMQVTFLPNTSNTGPATINVNGLGAVAIVKDNLFPLGTGDIIAGRPVSLIYSGSSFYMQSPHYFSRAVESFSRDLSAANGAVTISISLGVIPRRFRLRYLVSATAGLGEANYQQVVEAGENDYDALSKYADNVVYATSGVLTAASSVLFRAGPDASNYAEAVFTSMTASVLTITFTKTGSPTGILSGYAEFYV